MTDFFENIRLWEVLGWTMLNFLWMGCLLFVLSAGVRYAVRRSSPAVRYCTALLCLLAVTATAVGALFISLQQVEGLVAASELDPVQPDLDVAGTPPLHLNWMREGLTPAEPQPPANDRHTPADALRHEVFHGALRTCAGILPWLWICGTPFVALALLTGVIGTTRLRRRSNAVSDEPLLRHVQRLRTLLGISRRVGIAVCDQVSSPLVIGVLRPLIVLPPSIVSGLAPAQLEMILLHELAHVRRWDNLVNLLQRTIEALLFYHPVVWWASRWVRLEREHCCDALVLSHDHTPQSYAETLATLALPELAPQFATAAMANHQLTSRICHILNVEERTMTVSIRTLIGGIVLISAGVGGFLLATLRTHSAAADDPVPSAVAEPEERHSETEGRLMFGIGVNSDAGVVGTILLEDESESLLGLNADGGQVIGTSLQEWGRRAWSADEATGPPDVPEAGDNEQAWASLTEDGQVEWLRLRYDEPVPTAAIMVYESFNPGALIRVTSVDSEGAEVVIWEGEDPVAVRDGKGVAVVIPNQALELDRITLHLDSPKVAGWNEIDAVGLIDRFTGQVHWADSAEASSSYADHGAHTQADYHEFYHFFSRHDGTAIDKACQRCHRAHAGSATRREWIQQLRAELQRLEAELALEDATREPQELESQWRHPEAELAEEEREALLRWLQEGADNQFDETAQTAEEAYRDWVRRLFNKPEPVVDAGGGQEPDDATAEADRLEELRRTLQAQQQAIEELTELLQQLQHRLTPADDAGDAGTEADADDLGGNDINIPGVGPTPEAIDFAFPIEPNNVIDEFILQRLNGAGIEDAGEMTDEEFLRRIFLDLMGRLPTVEETRQYLENKSPEARQELIDELLQSEETADNWGKAWSFYVGLER